MLVWLLLLRVLAKEFKENTLACVGVWFSLEKGIYSVHVKEVVALLVNWAFLLGIYSTNVISSSAWFALIWQESTTT